MKFHYKISNLIAASCMSLFITMPVMAQTSVHDEHQHQGHAASSLSLDQGNKWHSDAPLRQGMQSINEAVINAVPVFHRDALTQSDADALANHINKQVEYMVANCQLTQQADAVLHVFIGDLLAGADQLAKHPTSMQGLPRIVGVLQKYPKYFDQPEWKEISHE